MSRNIVKTGLLTAILLFSGLLFAANAQSVTGSIANGTITRGVATRATVVLSLPSGLHVNSSRPGSEYAIATRVTARSSGGVKIGPVNYPRGKNRKFGFSEETLNVYDGRTPFTFNVTVPASYRKYSVVIDVSVKYQACTDEVCYSPKTKTIKLTASVL